jgi:hypothetical protein
MGRAHEGAASAARWMTALVCARGAAGQSGGGGGGDSDDVGAPESPCSLQPCVPVHRAAPISRHACARGEQAALQINACVRRGWCARRGAVRRCATSVVPPRIEHRSSERVPRAKPAQFRPKQRPRRHGARRSRGRCRATLHARRQAAACSAARRRAKKRRCVRTAISKLRGLPPFRVALQWRMPTHHPPTISASNNGGQSWGAAMRLGARG